MNKYIEQFCASLKNEIPKRSSTQKDNQPKLFLYPPVSLSEFLGELEQPHLPSNPRFNNRVKRNLYYFQGNYAWILLFLFVMYAFREGLIFVVRCLTPIAIALFMYYLSQTAPLDEEPNILTEIRVVCQKYPINGPLAVLIGLWFLFGVWDDIAILFVLWLFILVCHAASKRRSFHNHVVNFKQSYGLRTSQVSQFLEQFIGPPNNED